MARTIQIGAVCIEVTPDLVTTTLPNGKLVYGAPHDTPEYAEHARQRGYGDDVARSNRCHEVAHSLLAHLLGLECSPTFARLAEGLTDATNLTRDEEGAVLALERYASRVGVDLVGVAGRIGRG